MDVQKTELLTLPASPPDRVPGTPGILWAVAVLVALLGATIAVWHATRSAVRAEIKSGFDLDSDRIVSLVIDRLHDYQQLLWGGVGLIAADPETTREQWHTYIQTQLLERRLPGIQGVGFAKRIFPEEREAHIREMRKQGFPDYHMWPGGERSDYTAIVYLEPLDWRNQRAIGFDMLSEPVRRAAMEQARDSGGLATSGKVTLVQETNRDVQQGFLMYVPVYRDGEPAANIEQRRAALLGFVYAAFRINDLMHAILGHELTDIGLEIYDGSEALPAAMLYLSPSLQQESGRVLAPGLTDLVRRDIGGHPWTFRVVALSSYLAKTDQRLPLLILIAGGMISLLASSVVGVFAINRTQAVEAARRLSADVARREQVEEKLRESEGKFRLLFDNNPQPMWAFDRETLKIVEVNDTAVEKYGYSRDEFTNMRITDIRPPEDVPRLLELLPNRPPGYRAAGEWRHKLRDGSIIDVEIASHNMMLSGRLVTLVVGQDITERKRTREALRVAEARFRAIADHAPLEVSLKDMQGRYILANRRFQLRYKLEEAQIIGKTAGEILPPARAAADARQDSEALRRARTVQYEESWEADGKQYTTLYIHFPIPGADGTPEGVGTIAADVTELKWMEEQLRQAQKMEAVGHLTGGIAHDFNNLLTVIIGNAELLDEYLHGKAGLVDFVRTIQSSALRGAELTQRLLAFSRKQALQPVKVDLNQLVLGMRDLLRRTLSEDIEVKAVLAPDLWLAVADPSQVENALLNLAVNSRDAMPNGGTLLIETGNISLEDEAAASYRFDVRTGDYVMLSVSDTGIGMASEVLERAFEPFFTTKEVGKGSGLGLSMVYGFVKQSGGFVKIYSEPGQGTAVKLYLPRAAGNETAEEGEGAAKRAVSGGRERILVVEDDYLVRDYAVARLRALGYEVLEAPDGPEALTLLKGEAPVDLLFTDVILPRGMNGRELAEEATRLYPKLKVLYTSGYTENAVIHHGKLDRGVTLLSKPYRKEDLAAKIREVLDS